MNHYYDFNGRPVTAGPAYYAHPPVREYVWSPFVDAPDVRGVGPSPFDALREAQNKADEGCKHQNKAYLGECEACQAEDENASSISNDTMDAIASLAGRTLGGYYPTESETRTLAAAFLTLAAENLGD